jgi:2-ketoarginine methyltransferase
MGMNMSADSMSVEEILDTPWFQPELAKTLGYIRGFVASKVIWQMMQAGVLQDLRNQRSLREIADEKGFDPNLLRTVFEYLVVEDILVKEGPAESPTFRLSAYGARFSIYEGWFNILIGGYENVFSNISAMLREGAGTHARNGKWVGTGSCQISRYDTIPITKEFIRRVKPTATNIVDFGCGNALYLCTLARELDDIRAVGIEPDRGAYEAGLQKIRELGLEDRVRLVNVDALDYEIREEPDFILMGFVLQEIIGQIGREALVTYLRRMGRKFSRSYLMVMEVDYDIDNRAVMRSDVGMGYYNPYFLLHPFTNQLLLPKKSWDHIFAEAGYEIVIDEVTSPKADPTGLGICYVLKPAGE